MTTSLLFAYIFLDLVKRAVLATVGELWRYKNTAIIIIVCCVWSPKPLNDQAWTLLHAIWPVPLGRI